MEALTLRLIHSVDSCIAMEKAGVSSQTPESVTSSDEKTSFVFHKHNKPTEPPLPKLQERVLASPTVERFQRTILSNLNKYWETQS